MHGQLGHGEMPESRVEPVRVTREASGEPLTGIADLAMGCQHACALTGEASVLCWGRNAIGNLGNPAFGDVAAAVPVVTEEGGPPLSGVEQLVSGCAFTCALTGEGPIHCWGANGSGQLADGTELDRPVPVRMQASTGGESFTARTLSLAGRHGCAIRDRGEVWCWGANDFGRLGDGTSTPRAFPVPTDREGAPLGEVAELAVSGGYGCALRESDEVWCRGDASVAPGDEAFVESMMPVPLLDGDGGTVAMRALTGGAGATSAHACGLRAGGALWCWGDNQDGKLGDGTTQYRRAPVQVTGPGGSPLDDVTASAVGGTNTCAVTGGSRLWCWGANRHGQLGREGDASSVPVEITIPGDAE